jgi:hypothetical protein
MPPILREAEVSYHRTRGAIELAIEEFNTSMVKSRKAETQTGKPALPAMRATDEGENDAGGPAAVERK